MPRYVILRHETPPGAARPSHWDWMFERDGALVTWALEEIPHDKDGVAATALAPHRLAYLDYEGPVSGDRGVVTRWDLGNYSGELSEHGPATLRLRGKRLSGELRIQPSTNGSSEKLGDAWEFFWRSLDSVADGD